MISCDSSQANQVGRHGRQAGTGKLAGRRGRVGIFWSNPTVIDKPISMPNAHDKASGIEK